MEAGHLLGFSKSEPVGVQLNSLPVLSPGEYPP